MTEPPVRAAVARIFEADAVLSPRHLPHRGAPRTLIAKLNATMAVLGA